MLFFIIKLEMLLNKKPITFLKFDKIYVCFIAFVDSRYNMKYPFIINSYLVTPTTNTSLVKANVIKINYEVNVMKALNRIIVN